jgi:hypothetical protein
MRTITDRRFVSADYASIPLSFGRRLLIGQVWRSNDPRRLRGVEILDVDADLQQAIVLNIVNGVVSHMPFSRFTIGRDGWSLER